MPEKYVFGYICREKPLCCLRQARDYRHYSTSIIQNETPFSSEGGRDKNFFGLSHHG